MLVIDSTKLHGFISLLKIPLKVEFIHSFIFSACDHNSPGYPELGKDTQYISDFGFVQILVFCLLLPAVSWSGSADEEDNNTINSPNIDYVFD